MSDYSVLWLHTTLQTSPTSSHPHVAIYLSASESSLRYSGQLSRKLSPRRISIVRGRKQVSGLGMPSRLSIKAVRRRRKTAAAVKRAGKAPKATEKRGKAATGGCEEVREEENTSREGCPGGY